MEKIEPIPLINKNNKFILYTNCKCGGTLLKSWFLGTLELEKTFHNLPVAIKHYGLFFVAHWYTKFFGLHDTSIILSDEKYIRFFIDCYRYSTKKLLSEVQADEHYFKFVIAREPYSRIVSAYVDKFCGDDLYKPWVQEVISSVKEGKDEPSEISFSQFLDYLIEHDNDSVNRHWRRQNFILSDVKMDKIINLKNINKGLLEVNSQLNIENTIHQKAPNQAQKYGSNPKNVELSFTGEISNVELMKEKTKIGNFPTKEQFYNAELKDKVKHIYKEDFDRFSFDF